MSVDAFPATEAPRTTTPYAWYVACLISLAAIISVMDRYLLGVTLEAIKHDLTLTDSQLAIIQGPSFVLLFTVASLPFGRLADTGNRRIIISGALAFWSLATVACAFSNTFWELMAARMAVGLGEAALLPSAMSLLTAYFSKDKLSRATAFYTVGGPLGKGVGFIGGGAVLAYFAATNGASVLGVHLSPWQLVFLIGGSAGIAVSAFFFATVREPPRVTAPATKSKRGMAAGFDYFWRNRWGFLALFVPFAMYTAITQQLASWAVSFYVREHAIGAGLAAGIIGATGLIFGPLGQVVGATTGDWVRKRGAHGIQPYLLAGGLVVASTFVILFAAAPTVFWAASAFAVSQFVLNCSGPIAYGGVQLATPDEHRGIVSSVFLMTFTVIGNGFGPLLVALIGDFVFRSEQMLGEAIIAGTIIMTIAGAAFAILGRNAFTRVVRANDADGA